MTLRVAIRQIVRSTMKIDKSDRRLEYLEAECILRVEHTWAYNKGLEMAELVDRFKAKPHLVQPL